MPFTKARLNRAEKQQYLRCLERLHARGADVEIPPEWQDESCPLDVVLRPDGSTEMFDGPHGHPLFTISVRLIARQTPVNLFDCFCETEWEQLVPHSVPRQTQPNLKWGTRSYSLDEVLNDWLEGGLRFAHRGRIVEGLILFQGWEPIPDQYRGKSAPFTLIFADEWDYEIAVESKLVIPRVRKREATDAHMPLPAKAEPCITAPTPSESQPAQGQVRRRRSLFEPFESQEQYQSAKAAASQNDPGGAAATSSQDQQLETLAAPPEREK